MKQQDKCRVQSSLTDKDTAQPAIMFPDLFPVYLTCKVRGEEENVWHNGAEREQSSIQILKKVTELPSGGRLQHRPQILPIKLYYFCSNYDKMISPSIN